MAEATGDAPALEERQGVRPHATREMDDLEVAVKLAIAMPQHILKVGLLVAALFTCAAFYCLALVWLALFHIQTVLLLKTAVVLRLCLDEPGSDSSDGSFNWAHETAANELAANVSQKADSQNTDLATLVPTSGESVVPPIVTTADTTSDLPTGISNPLDKAHQSTAQGVEESSGVDSAPKHTLTEQGFNDRDEALEEALEQERKMDRAIVLTGDLLTNLLPDEDPPRSDEQQLTMLVDNKENAAVRAGRGKARNAPAEKGSSRPHTTQRNIQVSREERQAAAQAAWLESLTQAETSGQASARNSTSTAKPESLPLEYENEATISWRNGDAPTDTVYIPEEFIGPDRQHEAIARRQQVFIWRHRLPRDKVFCLWGDPDAVAATKQQINQWTGRDAVIASHPNFKVSASQGPSSPRKSKGKHQSGQMTELGYTAEQLAEAAGFAAEATRGGAKTKPSSSKSQARRAPTSGAPYTASPSRNPNQERGLAQSHLMTATSSSTHSRAAQDGVPPHMQRVLAARASQTSEDTGMAANGVLDAVSATIDRTSAHANIDNPADTRSAPLTGLAKGAQTSLPMDRVVVDQDVARAGVDASKPRTSSRPLSPKPAVTPSDGDGLQETNNAAGEQRIGDAPFENMAEGLDVLAHAPKCSSLQRMSFEQLLSMRPDECLRKLSAVSERKLDADAASYYPHVTAPVTSLVTPALRSVSIERLKEFNTLPKSHPGNTGRSSSIDLDRFRWKEGVVQPRIQSIEDTISKGRQASIGQAAVVSLTPADRNVLSGAAEKRSSADTRTPSLDELSHTDEAANDIKCFSASKPGTDDVHTTPDDSAISSGHTGLHSDPADGAGVGSHKRSEQSHTKNSDGVGACGEGDGVPALAIQPDEINPMETPYTAAMDKQQHPQHSDNVIASDANSPTAAQDSSPYEDLDRAFGPQNQTWQPQTPTRETADVDSATELRLTSHRSQQILPTHRDAETEQSHCTESVSEAQAVKEAVKEAVKVINQQADQKRQSLAGGNTIYKDQPSTTPALPYKTKPIVPAVPKAGYRHPDLLDLDVGDTCTPSEKFECFYASRPSALTASAPPFFVPSGGSPRKFAALASESSHHREGSASRLQPQAPPFFAPSTASTEISFLQDYTGLLPEDAWPQEQRRSIQPEECKVSIYPNANWRYQTSVPPLDMPPYANEQAQLKQTQALPNRSTPSDFAAERRSVSHAVSIVNPTQGHLTGVPDLASDEAFPTLPTQGQKVNHRRAAAVARTRELNQLSVAAGQLSSGVEPHRDYGLPPGLGNLQAARKAVFDSMVPEPGIGEEQVVCGDGGVTFDDFEAKRLSNKERFLRQVHDEPARIGTIVAKKGKQVAMLGGLKAFAAEFKLPSAGLEALHGKGLEYDDIGGTLGDSTVDGARDAMSELSTETPRQHDFNSEDNAQQEDHGATVPADQASEHADDVVEAETGHEKADLKRTIREKKRTARNYLQEMWYAREEARVKVKGTWSLEGAQGLEKATKAYNAARHELAECMASGVLNEEDAATFPELAKGDLSPPKVRPAGSCGSMRKGKAAKGSNGGATKFQPSAVQTAHEELLQKALRARGLLDDAFEYFRRPPPAGRTGLEQLKVKGQRIIGNATRYYRTKRKALEDAYSGVLPDAVETLLPPAEHVLIEGSCPCCL